MQTVFGIFLRIIFQLNTTTLLKILSWWLVEFVVVKMEILVDMMEIMTDKLESVMAKMAHGGE